MEKEKPGGQSEPLQRGKGAALLAAALVSLAVLHVQLAHFYTVDPLLAFFVMLTLNLAVDVAQGSGRGRQIALGVALNETVHFIMHYRRRRFEGASIDEALAGTFGKVGRPIVLTSLVNFLGFAIFLLSDFRPMYHFGMLASIAMAAALLGDLVLLPNLLKLADRTPRTMP